MFGIRFTASFGFGFLLMDRKMRPKKKKKQQTFNLQEESRGNKKVWGEKIDRYL